MTYFSNDIINTIGIDGTPDVFPVLSCAVRKKRAKQSLSCCSHRISCEYVLPRIK